MNKGIVFHYLSKALLLSSALFLVPALVSLYYREYFFMLIFLGVGGTCFEGQHRNCAIVVPAQ